MFSGDGVLHRKPICQQILLLREVSHVALARYHLVAHPDDPTRLTKILLLVNTVNAVAGQDLLIPAFFDGETNLVLFFVNNVLLQN